MYTKEGSKELDEAIKSLKRDYPNEKDCKVIKKAGYNTEVYKIEIGTLLYAVKLYRKAKENEIPGVRELSRANWMSSSQFKRWATVVDNWGDSQTPECIFYVRIHLNDQMSAKDVNLIERYFYKLVIQ